MTDTQIGAESARDNSPSNVIGFPAHGRASAEISFRLAHARQREARAWADYLGAKLNRENVESPEPPSIFSNQRDDYDRAWQEFRIAAHRMAMTPATDIAETRLKKAALGVWLNAEGPWYDQLRNAVARDEAAFPARRRSSGRKQHSDRVA